MPANAAHLPLKPEDTLNHFPVQIYASALLTSGDIPSIKLASEVLTCTADGRRNSQLVNYERSVALVSAAAKEYFNSAGSLNDPALEMAKYDL